MDNSLPFERLSDNHVFLPFDCGDEDINDFLLTRAVQYQKELLAVTYLLRMARILYFILLCQMTR